MKKVLIIFLFFLFLSNFHPRSVVADSNFERLETGQVIDSDYIRAAQTIQIDGTINGDAFLVGGLVTVNGPVQGDLFVAAAKTNINGPVGGSIRILSLDSAVNSAIVRNALVLSLNSSITKNASIGGSLLAASSNLDVFASNIGKGVRFFGNRLYLNSQIDKEVFVVADQEFILGPKSSISGILKYTGSKKLVSESGATVSGTVIYDKTSSSSDEAPRFFGAKALLQSYKQVKPITDFFGFLITALIGFILLGLFPSGFEKVVMAIENKPYASLGWGVVVLVSVPILVVLFALTIVGIPVSVVLLLIASIVWVLAQYLMAFFIGRKVLAKRFGERRGWALLLGLASIYLVGMIPVLGSIVKVFLFVFALGAIILAYRQPVIVGPRIIPFETKKTPRGKTRR